MRRLPVNLGDPTNQQSALSIAFRGRHLLLLDVIAIAASFLAAMGLRFDAPSALFSEYVHRYLWVLPILVFVRIGVFVLLGMYQRVWRYASVAELQAILGAVLASSVVGYGVVYALGLASPSLGGFPRSIPVIDSLVLLALVGGMRFSFLLFRLGRQGAGSTGTRALIVGAGTAGVAVAKQIGADPSLGMQLVGFADDEEAKGRRVLGLPVLGAVNELGALIREHGIGTVLFALPGADGPALRRLVRAAEREDARCLTVPSISEVVTGQITSALREVQVDDLLRRSPTRIDMDSVRGLLSHRTVLITGAGGSIGSELSRQVARFDPARIYLVGKGEGSIYEVAELLRPRVGSAVLEPVILDVRDAAGVARLMRQARPDVVFHAAAHKHVHFMERQPEEAVSVNVMGTANMLQASEECGVNSFVYVSTDKAVQPTNVMGATKRIGELLVRDAARRTGHAYVVVRFGNVLSSRGSVLPRFRRQLAEGGPLTVTHPEARRYFMTINEAVQLILQAAVLGKCGETFVLDMGEPVLIEDLARDLIELHGLVPGKDIAIEYTGLLPGEKLNEALFLPDEKPSKTIHESLWYAEDSHETNLVPGAIEALNHAAKAGQKSALIDQIKRLVPDYQPVDAAPKAWEVRS